MEEIKIINMLVSEIQPYENNPRYNENAVSKVAESIKEFGFRVPCVVDKDGVLITGHTRLKALEELGAKEVPVIIADDLTPEQVKAYRLADNKVSEFSDWDFDKLEEEIQMIQSIDMAEFGFIESEIDWAEVEELSDEIYEEPEVKKLRCPHCNHVDSANRFKLVEQGEE